MDKDNYDPSVEEIDATPFEGEPAEPAPAAVKELMSQDSEVDDA